MPVSLMKWITSPAHDEGTPPDLRLAVGVLLVEAAHMDDQFGPHERQLISRLLKKKFELSDGDVDQLISLSESTVARFVQLHPHTRTCFTHMEHDERVHVIEMLWEVAYADGALDPEEDHLIRRVAGLISVDTRERVFARQRVLSRVNRNQ